MKDTAGQERYRNLTSSYYREAKGILLVFDVCDRDSFRRVRDWMEQIRMNGEDDVQVVLVGAKADREESRVITVDEAERMAREFGIAYIETSAKDKLNVEIAFETLVRQIIQVQPDIIDSQKREDVVELGKEKTSRNFSCC